MSVADRRKINYISIENPASGLFRTQVLDSLCYSSKLTSASITLCVLLYPWHLLSKRESLLNLRKTCEENDIRLRLYPVLFPVKFSMTNSFSFKVTLAWLGLIAQLMPKCDVAHCRGYFATFMGIKLRGNCRVVFDMRSSWVDENIAAGRLVPHSRLHAKWLRLEGFCLRASACTLGVSEAMALVARRGPSRFYKTIPIAANAAFVGFSGSFRVHMRRELGWDSCRVAVYSGSFGLNQVNLEAITRLLGLLGRSEDNLRFLFLTPEDPKLIAEILRKAGIKKQRAKHFSISAEMLGDYLSIADFGIHALPVQPDSETRLGTKVVEYWMNGLPTLVTSSVGAAAKIINDFSVGDVISIDVLDCVAEEKQVDVSAMTRDNFVSAFEALDVMRFDVQRVAASYIEVYELLFRRTVGSVAHLPD